MSPTMKMLTHYYLSFLAIILGEYRITMLQLLWLTQWFFIQISLIHDNICSLIRKKCHPKSYHGDIKYHMTLNIIFTVLYTLRYTRLYIKIVVDKIIFDGKSWDNDSWFPYREVETHPSKSRIVEKMKAFREEIAPLNWWSWECVGP